MPTSKHPDLAVWDLARRGADTLTPPLEGTLQGQAPETCPVRRKIFAGGQGWKGREA